MGYASDVRLLLLYLRLLLSPPPLAKTSSLSWSVKSTLRVEEGLPKMLSLVAWSLVHLHSQCFNACGSSLQRSLGASLTVVARCKEIL